MMISVFIVSMSFKVTSHLRGCLLNLSGIACCSAVTAQSHSQGINQQKCQAFLDILLGCVDIGI